MSLSRELKRIRKQIFKNLLQALRIAGKCRRQRRIDIDTEDKALGFRNVMERALDAVSNRSKGNFFGFNRYRTGLDLR